MPSNNNKKDKRKLSTRIIIEENGYYLEATEVETEDGYDLHMNLHINC